MPNCYQTENCLYWRKKTVENTAITFAQLLPNGKLSVLTQKNSTTYAFFGDIRAMIASVLLLVDEAVLLHDLLLHRRVVHDLGLGQLGQQLTDGQDSVIITRYESTFRLRLIWIWNGDLEPLTRTPDPVPDPVPYFFLSKKIRKFRKKVQQVLQNEIFTKICFRVPLLI